MGAASGGVEGGLKAVPAEEAVKIEAIINQALRELAIQKAITERFISVGTHRTPYHFVSLKGLGPSTPETKSDYKSLQAQGVDFFLEVGVEKVGFNGGSGQDPQISFFMTSRIRAIQTSDIS